jgi:hypothetical protein
MKSALQYDAPGFDFFAVEHCANENSGASTFKLRQLHFDNCDAFVVGF